MMKLSQIKELLNTVESVNFKLEDDSFVPEHFHVTEVGVVTKNFIDCGGKVRQEKVANFQLWDANDFEHRLKPRKLSNIIALSERVLGMEDLEVEVEYQLATIGKFDLGFDGKNFILLAKKTACLASESCGTEALKKQNQLSENDRICCSPDANCC